MIIRWRFPNKGRSLHIDLLKLRLYFHTGSFAFDLQLMHSPSVGNRYLIINSQYLNIEYRKPLKTFTVTPIYKGTKA